MACSKVVKSKAKFRLKCAAKKIETNYENDCLKVA
jgi:hypothetical protein